MLEIIKECIITALNTNKKNFITSGYFIKETKDKERKLFSYTPNTTLNIFKGKEWKEILIGIGDELFTFLLLKCEVVQEINGNYILLCGSLDKFRYDFKNKMINRQVLFHKSNQKFKFDELEILSEVEEIVRKAYKGYKISHHNNKEIENFNEDCILTKIDSESVETGDICTSEKNIKGDPFKIKIKHFSLDCFFDEKVNKNINEDYFNGKHHYTRKEETCNLKQQGDTLKNLLLRSKSVDDFQYRKNKRARRLFVIKNSADRKETKKFKVENISDNCQEQASEPNHQSSTLDSCLENKENPCSLKNNSDVDGDSYEYDESEIQAILAQIKQKISQVNQKFTKVNIKPIFLNYFKSQIDIKNKKNAMECTVEYDKLVNFLFCLSKKIFKPIFSYKNFRILKLKLTLLTKKNKFETFSRTELLSKFKINQFNWVNGNSRVVHIINQQITSFFLSYIFENFFIATLVKYFYSTETCFSKYKVYYFPRLTWYHFSDIYIKDFLAKMCVDTGNYHHSSYEHVNKYIRSLPKTEGSRLIVNMSKGDGKKPSINKKLYPEFMILKNEFSNRLENSVLGYEQMHRRLYPFINEKSLYILKMDLKKCFDNIPHDYMLKIVEKFGRHKNYFVKAMYTFKKIFGECKFNKICRIKNEPFLISEILKNENLNDSCIIKEDVFESYLKREELVNNIKELIRNHKLLYRNKVHKQTKGIPQGSILSTLLCSIYMSYVDKKYFNRIVKSGKIVRYIDDFLIMTRDREEIKNFLKITKHLEKYGLFFAHDKIESNFVLNEGVPRFVEKDVNWCGLIIKSKRDTDDSWNTYIKMNNKDEYFKYTGAIFPIKTGQNIFNKMRRYFKIKTSDIIICKDSPKIHENIYGVFFVYCRRIFMLFRRASFINMNFVEKILKYSIGKMYATCKKRNISISKNRIELIAECAFSKFRRNKEGDFVN